ncbi:MAG TPA: DUF3817 domain-containing protein [Conexibacter sp.]|jgi:hypothetical protein
MSEASPAFPTATVESTKRLLNAVLVVGIIDLVLFVFLIISAINGSGAVHVLGPVHGIGFLILLALTGKGAMDGRWGWWFPIITLVTTGPPGSIVGDLILRKQIAEQEAVGPA